MNALKMVSVILLASIFLVLPVTSATTTITVTVNHPVIHPGQTLVVSGTTSPNVEVGITVFNPKVKRWLALSLTPHLAESTLQQL
jgi:hypothetical protein